MKKLYILSLACVLGLFLNTVEAKKEYFKEHIDRHKKEQDTKAAQAKEIYAALSSSDKKIVDDATAFINGVGKNIAIWNVSESVLIGRILSPRTSFPDIHNCLETLSPHQIKGVALSVRARSVESAALLGIKVNERIDLTYDVIGHSQFRKRPDLEKDILPISLKKKLPELSGTAQETLSHAGIRFWDIVKTQLQK